MAVYTQKYETVVDAIITKCAICPAVEVGPDLVVPKVCHTNNAMWDTGSTGCLISQNIVDELGLEAIDRAEVSQATISEEADVYLVHIGLPNGQVVLNVEALGMPGNDYDFVIGMDIIGQCDFAFTNKNEQSVFSVRRPAKEHIRFEY